VKPFLIQTFSPLAKAPIGWPSQSPATAARSTLTRLGKWQQHAPEDPSRNTVQRGDTRRWTAIGIVAACLLALVQAAPLSAQQHKSKIPIVGKISPFPGRQAYSGTVQYLDMKQKVLNVNSLHGKDTEIFPVKKDIHVKSLNGKKLELEALTPGTSVLIYYKEKGGEREVENIIVLESGKKGSKQAPAS